MGVESTQHLQVQVSPHQRCDLEQRPRPVRNTRQAAANHGLHTACEDTCGQRLAPDLAQLPRFLGQGTHHLHDKEGVTFGLAFDEINDLRLLAGLAQHRRTQCDDGRVSQPLQLEALHPRQSLRQARPFIIPIVAHNQQWQRVCHTRQVL